MNGLIGTKASAKFIFVATDDESNLPSKGEMKEYFPNHEMNIYKAWGRFRESFFDIQNYIGIRTDGILSHRSWSNNSTHCISHAIRLSSECKSNSFFNLKYQHICVGTYHLDHNLMKELDEILTLIRKINDVTSDIVTFGKTLDKGKNIVEQNDLVDLSMTNPCQQSLNKLLNGYGSSARQELEKQLSNWHNKALWI
jgi:hypothetical protein